MTTGTLVIDGSYGEGGGQILRSSLALSCITGRPIRIENIRAVRKNPGLQPQHLTSALAAAAICGGELSGATIGARTLEFTPGKVKPGSYVFDVSEIKSSAGSVGLVFQTVFPPLALAVGESRLTLRGGTHNPWAPTFNYIAEVFLTAMERMGVKSWARMEKAGYYPAGGGGARFDIEPPSSLDPLKLTERGTIRSLFCTSAVSNLPMDIARRQLAQGMKRLKVARVPVDGECIEYPSPGKGTTFFIHAISEHFVAGFSGLGALGKPAERVADEACDAFLRYHESNATVDAHLADQLVIPLALASGASEFATDRVTRHLLTNMWVTGRFLPVRFELQGQEGEPGKISVIP